MTSKHWTRLRKHFVKNQAFQAMVIRARQSGLEIDATSDYYQFARSVFDEGYSLGRATFQGIKNYVKTIFTNYYRDEADVYVDAAKMVTSRLDREGLLREARRLRRGQGNSLVRWRLNPHIRLSEDGQDVDYLQIEQAMTVRLERTHPNQWVLTVDMGDDEEVVVALAPKNSKAAMSATLRTQEEPVDVTGIESSE